MGRSWTIEPISVRGRSSWVLATGQTAGKWTWPATENPSIFRLLSKSAKCWLADFLSFTCQLSQSWTKHKYEKVSMARRRFFPGPETESARQLYQALIVAGVGIAFIGIFSTTYLAMTQGIREPFEAWIAGRIYFWMTNTPPRPSSSNKDEKVPSSMNYEEAWMKDDDIARHERRAEVEFDCWGSRHANQTSDEGLKSELGLDSQIKKKTLKRAIVQYFEKAW